VLSLYLIFGLMFVAMAVFLWVGTLFFQSYIYSEAVEQLFWRAPLVGLILTIYLAFWCSLDYRHPRDYGTFFDFSARQEEEFPRFLAVKKGKEIPFEGKKGAKGHLEYRDALGKPWRRSDADGGITEAIIVADQNGNKIRFDAELTADGKFALNDRGEALYLEEGGRGRVMTDSYIGKISRTRTGLVLGNLFLNILLLVLWVLCLWLLLQFHFWHAFGFGIILWLVLMLTILPMLFKATEDAARRREMIPSTAATFDPRPKTKDRTNEALLAPFTLKPGYA
jgi:hypothetical protein